MVIYILPCNDDRNQQRHQRYDFGIYLEIYFNIF